MSLSKAYAEKLRDGRWQQKRLKIFERDGFSCSVCGAADNLQIHHNWYLKNHEPWDYEGPQLATLCEKHHEEATEVQNKLKQELSRLDYRAQATILEWIARIKARTVGNVRITANRGDEEPWRLERLQKVVDFLRSFDDVALLHLLAINDHKGTLEVLWSTHTPESSIKGIEAAWNQQSEYDVRHFFGEW